MICPDRHSIDRLSAFQCESVASTRVPRAFRTALPFLSDPYPDRIPALVHVVERFDGRRAERTASLASAALR